MRKLAAILLFLLIPSFSGTVVVNSNDWREVLLGMEYAHFTGDEVRFLISVRQADALAQNLPPKGVTVIETSNPVMPNYAYYLSKQYSVDAIEKKFKDYKEIQRYILKYFDPKTLVFISEYEPENAIISLPYAFRKNGAVFISESSIFSKLGGVNKICIVGHLRRDHQRSILSTAGALGKEVVIVNRGSPHANSLELLDKWGKAKKVVLTTGNFFETTLATSSYPILLVGKSEYPKGLLDELQKAGTSMVYVVGTELLPVAQKIRADSGRKGRKIYVLWKYGEGYSQAGMFSEVSALTMFRIPLPRPNITFMRAIYDSGSKKLYITLFNQGDGAAYFLTTLQIMQYGKIKTTLRDDEPFVIWPGEVVTKAFTIELEQIGTEGLVASLLGKYGRYEDFLVQILEQERPIEFGVLEDNSEISAVRATYDGRWLRVYVKNTGSVTAYITGYITLELDKEQREFFGGDLKLAPGQTGVLKVRIQLTKEDLDANSVVEVHLRYGEKRNLLVNSITQHLELEIVRINLMLVAGIAIPAIIAILLILLISRRKKRKYYRIRKRFKKIKRAKLRPTRRRRKPVRRR